MGARFTIFQKGLLLVAVPAMIQLALIWSLYRTQQHQAEAQHWATHTKEVLGQAQRILTLLVEGHNYKTAADELNVSINTIRFHMRSIYEKLQVHSKSEAVSKALRNRIIR